MINKFYHKVRRDKICNINNEFIYDQIANRLIDSIDILNISLNKILEIGANSALISNYLIKKFSNANLLTIDISKNKMEYYRYKNFVILDHDEWNIKDNLFDLIYSNLYIYISNDFEKLLNNIYNSLKPNGFFITTIPGKNNLNQIKKSMIKIDLELYGGAYNR